MIGFKLDKIVIFTRRLDRETDKADRKFRYKAAGMVRTIARRSIKFGGKKRRRSKPGEPPRWQRGAKGNRFKDRIFFHVDSPRMSEAIIGPELSTGNKAMLPALEFGGISNGSNIAPRPYMGPALDTTTPKLDDLWASAIK